MRGWFIRPALILALAALACTPLAEAKGKSKYKDDFEAFRKHVDKTYPFFDLKKIRKDWKSAKKALEKRAGKCKTDGEFILLVSDALKVLRDAHFQLRPREGVEVDWPEYWYPGIALMAAADGKVVFLHGPPGRESAIKTGMIVTKINGKPARKQLEKMAKKSWEEGGGFSSPQRARIFTYRTPFVGEKGEKHVLTYLDGRKSKELKVRNDFELKGWARTYNMPKGLKQEGKSFWHAKLESGVGYMYWRRIDDSIENGIPKAIEAHGDVKGWIVDLRGNSGGGYGNGLISAIKDMSGPVAVITDAGCISAGETMIRDLVGIHEARVFGTTSAGSSSSKKSWEFPSKIATIVYSTRSRGGLEGKPIEFNGIAPHEEVEPRSEDMLAGRNTEILAAEAWILK